MGAWKFVLELWKSVSGLTKQTKANKQKIEKLEQNQIRLIKAVNSLKQSLDLERQRNQQQKELYNSEINRYKAESDNKLKEIKILLLEAKIDNRSSNPNQLPES